MLTVFNKLNSNFNNLSLIKLYRYGFVIYLPNNVSLKEINNIKAIVCSLSGVVSFFNNNINNIKCLNFKDYFLIVTFPSFEFSLNFPYYLDSVFSNFNFFPFYFKFGYNLIPLNSNFIFDKIQSLFSNNTSATLTNILDLNRRRLLILFRFFFNSLFIFYNKKCQL